MRQRRRTSNRKVLVAIFQRGAADGLNIVVPFFEPRYYQVRPRHRHPAARHSRMARIDLDGRFALHPVLQPLKAMWDSGQLAIVHAAGSHDSTRSHFDAQDFMECGTPGIKTEDGWLNRALPPGTSEPSPVRAVAAAGAQLPQSFAAAAERSPSTICRGFRCPTRHTRRLLERLYAASADASIESAGKATFDAVKLIESIRTGRTGPRTARNMSASSASACSRSRA